MMASPSSEAGAAASDQSSINIPDELEAEIVNIMWMRKHDLTDKPLFYNVALEIWTAKDKLFASRVEKKTTQSLSVRNEIYQLIGFYSVFQGVLLTAVAQSNLLHCNNWWSAFTLSALASIVTVGGVMQKFSTVWSLEKTIGGEDIARKQVVDQLKRLKFEGEAFSFQGYPKRRKDYTAGKKIKAHRKKILRYSIIAVVTALISFSATFLVTIRQVLCNPGHSLLPGSP